MSRSHNVIHHEFLSFCIRLFQFITVMFTYTFIIVSCIAYTFAQSMQARYYNWQQKTDCSLCLQCRTLLYLTDQRITHLLLTNSFTMYMNCNCVWRTCFCFTRKYLNCTDNLNSQYKISSDHMYSTCSIMTLLMSNKYTMIELN